MSVAPRVALDNPINLIQRKNMDVYGFVLEYVRQFRPLIYLSPDKAPLRYAYLRGEKLTKERIQAFLASQGIEYPDGMFITDVAALGREADILLSLNGQNHRYRIERRFPGLKVGYTDDYNDYAVDAYRNLRRSGVAYVLSNGQLDEYSEFYRAHYPFYVGRTRSITLGFSPRFRIERPFAERINRCLAVGSVLPLRNSDRYIGHEVLVTRDNKVVHERLTRPLDRIKYYAYFNIINKRQTDAFSRWHKGERFLQPFRGVIVEREQELLGIVDSKLPRFPKIKDYSFDMNAALNDYKMVLVDDGLLSFVGAKTYEAIASGAVVVMPDYPYTAEWGFEDGKNCIRYRPMDLEDLKRKVQYYQEHQGRLAEIQREGHRFVTERFSHAKVAQLIDRHMRELWRENRKEEETE